MACRSDPGAGAGGQGADAPALLSEDAAGQKVKVFYGCMSDSVAF